MRIRSRQRPIVTVAALVFGPPFMLGPAAAGVGILLGLGPGLSGVAVFVLLLCLSAFLSYHMLQNFHWVELDGDVLRGRKFWTRRLVEGAVGDVTGIVPLGAVVPDVTNLIIDQVLGPVRGYEIRFADGRRLALVRHDMTGVDELVAALADRCRASARGGAG